MNHPWTWSAGPAAAGAGGTVTAGAAPWPSPLGQRRGERAALGGVGLQARQAAAQHRRLHAVEAGRVADDAVQERGALAVGAQQAQAIGDVGVAGEDRARVAPGPEGRGRPQREAPGVAERAGAAAGDDGAGGVRGVLDDAGADGARHLGDGLDVGGRAGEVDDDDRGDARVDDLGQGGGREQAGLLVDVGRADLRPEVDDRLGDADVGGGGDDDDVAARDAERLEREADRGGARADADRVAGAERGGQLVLEGRDRAAEREVAGLGGRGDGGQQLGQQLGVVGVRPAQGHAPRGRARGRRAAADGHRRQSAPPGGASSGGIPAPARGSRVTRGSPEEFRRWGDRDSTGA